MQRVDTLLVRRDTEYPAVQHFTEGIARHIASIQVFDTQQSTHALQIFNPQNHHVFEVIGTGVPRDTQLFALSLSPSLHAYAIRHSDNDPYMPHVEGINFTVPDRTLQVMYVRNPPTVGSVQVDQITHSQSTYRQSTTVERQAPLLLNTSLQRVAHHAEEQVQTTIVCADFVMRTAGTNQRFGNIFIVKES